MRAAGRGAGRLLVLGGLLMLGGLLGSGCGPRLVDPCEARDVGAQTCIGLQVGGALGEVERLVVTVQGDWVGTSEVNPGSPFALPVALAVALPPTFQGKVRVAVTALRSGAEIGSGALVTALKPGEHRALDLALQATASGDLGARD